MPAVSIKQQRLFAMALACKRGEMKNPSAKVKELADSMSEKELEKYAKTSHEDLPEKVKESLDEFFNVYVELVEAELGEDLETYDFETLDLDEGKALKIEQPDGGKPLANAKTDDIKKVGNLADAKPEKPATKSFPDGKDTVKDGKNEIPMPAGKETPSDKTDTTAHDNVDKKVPPVVDNSKDEKDKSWDKGFPGMEPSKKSVMGNIYTPQLHKFPMSTNSKNERRVFDFEQFLQKINYHTHDEVLQKGHGQNRQGKDSAA